MENSKDDPLNPGSEQQLYEKLVMTQEELEDLNYIRDHVKIIIKQDTVQINIKDTT